MEFLPLEVQEHIGVYLPPNEYKQFWMSFRNFLPLKQRIRLRTLRLCGQLEHPTLKENARCFTGLQLVGMHQLSPDDWKELELAAHERYYSVGLSNFYLDAIRMILKRIPVWFKTERNFDFALQICCCYGVIDLVQTLLNHLKKDPCQYALLHACKAGHPKIVELLLKDGRVFSHRALKLAISGRYAEIVKLLLQDPRVFPFLGFCPLLEAIEVKSAPIVKLLLNYECINPSVHDLWMACHEFDGNCDIVRLLLEDPRVDPSDNENECIRTASAEGQKELVKLLLQDPRVDPSVEKNECLGYAVGSSDLELAKILLDDDRIDTKHISGVVLKAVGTGTLKILKFLLDHPKLDIELEQFEEDLIAIAAAHNNITILKFLLKDGRFLPREKAVSEASRHGFTDAVEILLSDTRMNLRQAKVQYYLNRAEKNQPPKKFYCRTCDCDHYVE